MLARPRDPAAQVVRARLLYLLGWSYDLEGDSGQAIQADVDLMRQFPASPWSWLAAARLEVVE